jgi:serine/threonine protein kinase
MQQKAALCTTSYASVLARLNAASKWSAAITYPWTHVLSLDPAKLDAPVDDDTLYKIHVSSTTVHAQDVLSFTICALSDVPAPFKFASDSSVLRALNQGSFGLEQIGKFITVYYRRFAHAVHFRAAFERLVPFLTGPAISTDLSFSSRASIYLRVTKAPEVLYHDKYGRLSRGWRAPDSSFVMWDKTLNTRLRTAYPEMFPPERREIIDLIRQDFRILKCLHRSFKGAVLLLTTVTGDQKTLYVAKIATANGEPLDLRRDPSVALQDAYEIQRRVSEHRAPGSSKSLILLVAESGSRVLLYPYIEGMTFFDFLTKHCVTHRSIASHLAVVFQSIVQDLLLFHRCKVSVNDISPGNVIISTTYELAYIIDLEHASTFDPNSVSPLPSRGTPGFIPLQALSDGPARDLYALIALSVFAATGLPFTACPAASQWDALIERRAQRAAKSDSADKITRIAVSAYQGVRRKIAVGNNLRRGSNDLAVSKISGFVHQICTHYLGDFLRCPEMFTAEVYDGVSGYVITMFELDMLGVLRAQQRMILSFLEKEQDLWENKTSLMFGQIGIAIARDVLGGSGEMSETMDSIERNCIQHIDISGRNDLFLDITHGLSGLGLVAAELEKAGLDRGCRKRLHEQIISAIDARGVSNNTMTFWPWPGDGGKKEYLGFAHGCAGILMYAETIWTIYKLPKAKSVAHKAVETLARSVESKDGLVFWPTEVGSNDIVHGWCHGFPGIIKALARSPHWLACSRRRDLIKECVVNQYQAFVTGMSLCHGKLSILDMLCDLRDRGMLAPKEITWVNQRCLELLDYNWCKVRGEIGVGFGDDEAGSTYRGLMTGRIGLARTLARWFHMSYPKYRLLP